MNQHNEEAAFRARMKEEGKLIDPKTAEVACDTVDTLDPYGLNPSDAYQIGREWFARRPGGEWVHWSDLPKETVQAIRDAAGAPRNYRPEDVDDDIAIFS